MSRQATGIETRHARVKQIRVSTMRGWLCGIQPYFHTSPEGRARYLFGEVPDAVRRQREKRQRQLEREEK